MLTSKSDITPPTSPDTSQSNLRFDASFSSLSLGSHNDLRILPMLGQPYSSDFPDHSNFADFAVFLNEEKDEDHFNADFIVAQVFDDARSSTDDQSSANSGSGQRRLQRCDASFHKAVIVKELSNRSLNHQSQYREPSASPAPDCEHNEDLDALLSALSPTQLAERFISSQILLSCQHESFHLDEMDKKSKKKKASKRQFARAATA